MIQILVMVLVLLIVAGIASWAIAQLPLMPPWRGVAQAILAVIVIIVLLGMVFGGVQLPTWDLRH